VDWSNENYVRVYTRETDDDLALTWEARALWDRMLTKFDRSGFVETRRGARGLAAITRIPPEVVDRVLPELLEDGRLVQVDGGYLAPNFIAAQEARKSDRQRQRESRERRRAQGLGQIVTERDDEVTNRDAVTNRDESSRSVTLCSADPDPLLCTASGGAVTNRDAAEASAVLPVAPRAQRRRQLFHESWLYAAEKHRELRAAGVDAAARDCWGAMPPAGGAEAQALLARIDELTEGDEPDWDRASEVIRNRVDVAAAEARREAHLRYFIPARLWNESSFAIGAALSPAQAAQPRAPARASHSTAPVRRIQDL
jgi:hypothetical protein